jgi:addiction module HigA family antidote
MARAAIHPGEHLAEELKALGMSAAELARQMKVPTNRVTAILNGQRALTGDTALRLGHFFGTSAEFWLNLQSLSELRLAEKRVGKTIRNLPTLKRQKIGLVVPRLVAEMERLRRARKLSLKDLGGPARED